MFVWSKGWALTLGAGKKSVCVQYKDRAGNVSATAQDWITLGTYLHSWLEESASGTVSRHTQRDHEDKVRLHINPALGSKRLQDLTTADLVRKNVARWARPPKAGHAELPVLSVEEAGRFLKAIRDDRLEALYLIAVTTGLRRGDLLGLKWGDFDPERGTLKVSRSLDTKYGPARENAPKRAASRRPAVSSPRPWRTPRSAVAPSRRPRS